MSKNDGGPAFPVPKSGGVMPTGMTLRQYYAGQALAGLDLARVAHDLDWQRSVAWDCFSVADAMIAEGEKDDG